jgi:hypothetical protein
MSNDRERLRVAIIDCGIDLHKLYSGDRHGYEAVWVPVEDFSLTAVEHCDIVVIPAGSDNTLLGRSSDDFRKYLLHGGWIFSFDGLANGVLDDVQWLHTPTDYKRQQFSIPDSTYKQLLEAVDLEGLTTKDGVKGWWCEGELVGNRLTPIVLDEKGRIIIAVAEYEPKGGRLIATAAGRLPLFSSNESLAPNVLFKNLLISRAEQKHNIGKSLLVSHVYIHSGNFAHRSFLLSNEFGDRFTGVHWSGFDEITASCAASIWIPWESNIRAVQDRWPILERAVANGSTLVIEDLRGNWLPGVTWYARPVDSSWWREKRVLDLTPQPFLLDVFCGVTEQVFFWHYHGAFDGPQSGKPLLTTSEGKLVLSLLKKPEWKGQILLSTLDATFEFGVGKITETRNYIVAVLRFIEGFCVEANNS